MSMPHKPESGKPRRLGLYLPFALLLVAVAVWSGFWLWAQGELARRLDAASARLAVQGYQVAWKDRRIGGYPFRMDVTLSDVRAREPGGWALSAPRLEAEAPAYALGDWLIAAPDGLTFVRPESGPVGVSGKLIRASLTHLTRRPPSFSFEGVDLAFHEGAGAKPFGLTAAQRVEFHLRAGPDDQGGVFFDLEGGQARLSGLLARMAEGKPISMAWNATLSKMSAFSGRDWPDAVRRWSDAGGRMTLRSAALIAGEALVRAENGTLAAAPSGRLDGVMTISVREAPKGFSAMADTGLIAPDAAQAATAVARADQGAGDLAHGQLHFEAGRTTFGPVSLGPALKVYDPR
jgi:hypothetical protein